MTSDADLPDAGCIVDAAHPFVVTTGNRDLLSTCVFKAGGQIVLHYEGDPAVEETIPRKAALARPSAPVAAEAPVLSEPTPSAPADVPVTATTEAPSAVAEVNSVIQQAGGANGYAVLLALIAVAGGGAGWKFYQTLAKQKHEQRMKELELQADTKNNHQACEAKHALLQGKVDELSSKLTALEQKSETTIAAGNVLDPEEVEKRLKKLEASLKRTKSTSGR